MDKYKVFIENELKNKCKSILDLLDSTLLKRYEGKGDENEVFYSKMAGDYYRYLAEISNENQENGKKAEAMYQKAMDAAKNALPETHPTRLGLALNFSVWFCFHFFFLFFCLSHCTMWSQPILLFIIFLFFSGMLL